MRALRTRLVRLRRVTLSIAMASIVATITIAPSSASAAEPPGDARAQALAAWQGVEALRRAGRTASAREAVGDARARLEAVSAPDVHAYARLVEALLARSSGEEAAGAFERALAAANAANEPVLAVKSALGLAGALAPSAGDRAWPALQQAHGHLARVGDDAARADLGIAVAEQAIALAGDGAGTDAAARRAYAVTVLEASEDAARRLDPSTPSARGVRARALLVRARLERATHGDDAALPVWRSAAFAAQDAPALQYRAQWEVARALARRGDVEGALAAYRLAAQTVQAAQQARGAGEVAAANADASSIHFELADLLLRRSAAPAAAEPRETLLREARLSIESLKAAQLRDYFQDDCVTELQERITPIDRLPPGQAALYPVILPDRLELVVSLPTRIAQVTVPIARKQLEDDARALRRALEKRTTREYLPLARRLHERVIAPIEPLLREAGIDTLAIVPQGPLVLVPLAALHDGTRFLVERYALASSPGLSLTDARPLPQGPWRVMLAGLSQPVAGFVALERVPEELAGIREAIGGTVLQDEAFDDQRFERALERDPYTVVHVASHAQLGAEPRDNFLLTYSGRLSLERLGEIVGVTRYRSQPLELLSLSACETAAGDERAALGLAGIAVKAGARSALAGLWAVDDEASARLMTDFYRHLKGPGHTSKARALQQAQLGLLHSGRYAHPGYWAPFLLIGSWQ